MGIFIFLLYYLLMTAGRVFGKMGVYHPAIGLWAPNIVIGIGGLVMLVRTANEKPTYLVQVWTAVGKMVKRIVLSGLKRFMH